MIGGEYPVAAENGIGVRDGRFCAHPLLARLHPDGDTAARASLGLGSQLSDVGRLVDAVASLHAHGPQWTSATAAGSYLPRPDPRPLPPWLAGTTVNAGATCTQTAASPAREHVAAQVVQQVGVVGCGAVGQCGVAGNALCGDQVA